MTQKARHIQSGKQEVPVTYQHPHCTKNKACLLVEKRRSQSQHKDHSVLGWDVVAPLGKSICTLQKHYGPLKHKENKAASCSATLQ
jgi:hypothetical protein